MTGSTKISNQPRATGLTQLQPYWRWLAAAALVGMGIVLWLAAGMPGTSWLVGTRHVVTKPPGDDNTSEAKTTVAMSATKLAEAKIESQIVQREALRTMATVPGRVTHDPTRRLEITASVDCVVLDVLVQPGQRVERGDRLVELASPDVGLARDQVARAKDDLHLAKHNFENADDVYTNAKELVAALEQNPTPAAALKQFSGKRLGEHREHVLAAYSKLVLAKAAVEETNNLGTSGALSRRVIQQRQSELEVAAAGFESQRETTLFECLQAQHKAAAQLAQDDRLHRIAQGKLKRLLGALAIEDDEPPKQDDPTDEDKPSDDGPTEKDLSQFVVLAAQAGNIEDHVVVRRQRLKAGDDIVTVADTSLLWISASVPENQWQATALRQGDKVTVRLPALNDEMVDAKVRFIGSQVSDASRTLPLVAEIDNSGGTLKPGMFAWVSLPVEEVHESLVVPASAVTRHENQAFVFLDEGGGKFRRVDVRVGQEFKEKVEIVSGLKGGERIVTSGVLMLKSELLLEHEE